MAKSSWDSVKGIVVQIGGDTTGLKQAFQEVDKQVTKTSSNLRDVEKLLKLDPTNIDLLKQKIFYLGEQVRTTTDKLNLLNQINKQAEDDGVEKNTEEYRSLQREIERTTQALNKYTDELLTTKENSADLLSGSEELEEAQKNVTRAFANSNKEIKKSGKEFKAGLQNLKNYVQIAKAVVDTVVRIAKAMVDMAKESSSSAKEIQKLSKQTKLSVQEIQELGYVAEIAGTDMGTLTKTVKQNLIAMKEASKYNWQYMDAYHKLGIEIYDTNGELRDSGEVYWEVISALREMEETTERDIIAETLLGRKSTDLNNILAMTEDEFNGLVEEANNLGIILGEDTIDTLANLDTEFIKLQSQLDSTKSRLVAEFTPALIIAIETLRESVSQIRDLIEGTLSFENYFGDLGNKIGEFVKDFLSYQVNNLPEIIDGVVEFAFELIDSIVDILTEADWVSIMLDLMNKIQIILLDKLPVLFFDLVPKISELVGSLIGKIFTKDFWGQFVKVGANLGIAIINGLISTVEGGINGIIGVINGIIKWFGGHINEVTFKKLNYLAKGGIVSEGGQAIVGEAGAELLTVNKGKATVQPLTANVNTAQLAKAMQNQQSQQVIQINFTGSLSQLAKILQPEIQKENVRVGESLLTY